MSASFFIHKSPSEAACGVCGRTGEDISKALGVCRDCIIEDTDSARGAVARARIRARERYSTPPSPPRAEDGKACRICVNLCRMGPGELGFCGLRENRGGRVHSRVGTSRLGIFTA